MKEEARRLPLSILGFVLCRLADTCNWNAGPQRNIGRPKQHMREPQTSDCSGNIQPSFAPHTSAVPESMESGLSLTFSEARTRYQGALEGFTMMLLHHMLSDLNLRHAKSWWERLAVGNCHALTSSQFRHASHQSQDVE